MLELGRKEQHLMSGIGVQILIVGLLVFIYTQAVRQLNRGKDLSQHLQEQLTVAREKVARQGGKSELAQLQARVADLKGSMVTPDGLVDQGQRLEQLAAERFGIRGVKVTTSELPAEKVSIPLEGQPDLEIRLQALEMKGAAPVRALAGLIVAVGDPGSKPLCPLVAMELKPQEFLLRWLVAVSPDSTGSVQKGFPAPAALPAWGPREEPFLSPFSHPNALRTPPERKGEFRLSGIVQQDGSSTCVINGQVLKPADWVGGYQVVLITRDAVLLEGKGEELLLRLP